MAEFSLVFSHLNFLSQAPRSVFFDHLVDDVKDILRRAFHSHIRKNTELNNTVFFHLAEFLKVWVVFVGPRKCGQTYRRAMPLPFKTAKIHNPALNGEPTGGKFKREFAAVSVNETAVGFGTSPLAVSAREAGKSFSRDKVLCFHGKGFKGKTKVGH